MYTLPGSASSAGSAAEGSGTGLLAAANIAEMASWSMSPPDKSTSSPAGASGFSLLAANKAEMASWLMSTESVLGSGVVGLGPDISASAAATRSNPAGETNVRRIFASLGSVLGSRSSPLAIRASCSPSLMATERVEYRSSTSFCPAIPIRSDHVVQRRRSWRAYATASGLSSIPM